MAVTPRTLKQRRRKQKGGKRGSRIGSRIANLFRSAYEVLRGRTVARERIEQDRRVSLANTLGKLQRPGVSDFLNQDNTLRNVTLRQNRDAIRGTLDSLQQAREDAGVELENQQAQTVAQMAKDGTLADLQTANSIRYEVNQGATDTSKAYAAAQLVALRNQAVKQMEQQSRTQLDLLRAEAARLEQEGLKFAQETTVAQQQVYEFVKIVSREDTMGPKLAALAADLQIRRSEALDALTGAETQLASVKGRVEGLIETINATTKEISETGFRTFMTSAELDATIQRLQNDLQEQLAQMAELRAEAGRIQAEISAAATAKETLQTDLTTAQNALKTAIAARDAVAAELEAYQDTAFGILAEEAQELDAQQKDLEDQIQQLEDTIDELKDDLDTVNTTLSNLDASRLQTQSNKDRARLEAIDLISKRLADIDTAVQESGSRLDAATVANEATKTLVESTRAELATYLEDMMLLKGEVAALQTESGGVSKDVQDAIAQFNKTRLELEARLQQIQDAATRVEDDTALLRAIELQIQALGTPAKAALQLAKEGRLAEARAELARLDSDAAAAARAAEAQKLLSDAAGSLIANDSSLKAELDAAEDAMNDALGAAAAQDQTTEDLFEQIRIRMRGQIALKLIRRSIEIRLNTRNAQLRKAVFLFQRDFFKAKRMNTKDTLKPILDRAAAAKGKATAAASRLALMSARLAVMQALMAAKQTALRDGLLSGAVTRGELELLKRDTQKQIDDLVGTVLPGNRALEGQLKLLVDNAFTARNLAEGNLNAAARDITNRAADLIFRAYTRGALRLLLDRAAAMFQLRGSRPFQAMMGFKLEADSAVAKYFAIEGRADTVRDLFAANTTADIRLRVGRDAYNNVTSLSLLLSAKTAALAGAKADQAAAETGFKLAGDQLVQVELKLFDTVSGGLTADKAAKLKDALRNLKGKEIELSIVNGQLVLGIESVFQGRLNQATTTRIMDDIFTVLKDADTARIQASTLLTNAQAQLLQLAIRMQTNLKDLTTLVTGRDKAGHIIQEGQQAAALGAEAVARRNAFNAAQALFAGLKTAAARDATAKDALAAEFKRRASGRYSLFYAIKDTILSKLRGAESYWLFRALLKRGASATVIKNLKDKIQSLESAVNDAALARLVASKLYEASQANLDARNELYDFRARRLFSLRTLRDAFRSYETVRLERMKDILSLLGRLRAKLQERQDMRDAANRAKDSVNDSNALDAALRKQLQDTLDMIAKIEAKRVDLEADIATKRTLRDQFQAFIDFFTKSRDELLEKALNFANKDLLAAYRRLRDAIRQRDEANRRINEIQNFLNDPAFKNRLDESTKRLLEDELKRLLALRNSLNTRIQDTQKQIDELKRDIAKHETELRLLRELKPTGSKRNLALMLALGLGLAALAGYAGYSYFGRPGMPGAPGARTPQKPLAGADTERECALATKEGRAAGLKDGRAAGWKQGYEDAKADWENSRTVLPQVPAQMGEEEERPTTTAGADADAEPEKATVEDAEPEPEELRPLQGGATDDIPTKEEWEAQQIQERQKRSEESSKQSAENVLPYVSLMPTSITLPTEIPVPAESEIQVPIPAGKSSEYIRCYRTGYIEGYLQGFRQTYLEGYAAFRPSPDLFGLPMSQEEEEEQDEPYPFEEDVAEPFDPDGVPPNLEDEGAAAGPPS